MLNPNIALAILGEMNRPKRPTTIPPPDMSGAFGLSSENFNRMFAAQSQRGAAEAQLQADAADEWEQRRRFNIQTQMAQSKILNDAFLGQESLTVDQGRAQTSRLVADEGVRSNKAGEVLDRKGLAETARRNKAAESSQSRTVGIAQGRLDLEHQRFVREGIMDDRANVRDDAKAEYTKAYYESLTAMNNRRGGAAGVTVAEGKILLESAYKYASLWLGLDPTAPLDETRKAEYFQIVDIYLQQKGAEKTPIGPKIDFNFSGTGN